MEDTSSGTLPSFSSGISTTEVPGGDNNATNPLYPVAQGGPLGPHQFLASTWRGFMKARPNLFQGMTDDQAMAARSNPTLSTAATEWLAGENAKVLKAHGFDPTPQNLGLAHAFGGSGASMILKYGDDAKLADVLRATQPGMADDILAKNPQYRTATVGDVRGKYAFLNKGYNSPLDIDTTPAPTTPPPVTPPTAPATAANGPLAQYQRLALLNRLLTPTQQAPVPAVASASSPYAWASALRPQIIPLQNPLQIATTLQALNGSNPLLT